MPAPSNRPDVRVGREVELADGRSVLVLERRRSWITVRNTAEVRDGEDFLVRLSKIPRQKGARPASSQGGANPVAAG